MVVGAPEAWSWVNWLQKTPAIQAVEAMCPAPAVAPGPACRTCPWGRSTARSLAVVTRCASPANADHAEPSGAVSASRTGSSPYVSGIVPGVTAKARRGEKIVPTASSPSPTGGSGRHGAAATNASIAAASAGPDASAWDLWNTPTKPPRAVSPGASVTGGACNPARVCSCCQRRPGRSRDRSSPPAGSRSCTASVTQPAVPVRLASPSHGWPDPGMFCRTARQVPSDSPGAPTVSGVRSRYWET